MMQPLLDNTQLEGLSTLWANSLIALSFKGMLLLICTGLVTWQLRNRAAATRHAVWTASVLALLVLPALSILLPSLAVSPLPDWQLRAQTPEVTAKDNLFEESATGPSLELLLSPSQLSSTKLPVETSGTGVAGSDQAFVHRSYFAQWPADESDNSLHPASLAFGERVVPKEDSLSDLFTNLLHNLQAWSAKTWALLVWELGALLVMSWFALGSWRVSRLGRQCTAIGDTSWDEVMQEAAESIGLRRTPRLLWTANAWTPLTFGFLRPVVILPERARDWPDAQRYEVLLHEFAHVQRRDLLTQCLAQLACALF